jgi:membrane-bound ClpP family serine protease
VAGYTESIGSTMNPLVGFDTMRRMGANYFKAFGTYLLLLVFSVFIYFGVSIVTAPLAVAGLGNVPAQLLGNIVSFYLYIVTACIFGLALYRSHEKLGFSVAG